MEFLLVKFIFQTQLGVCPFWKTRMAGRVQLVHNAVFTQTSNAYAVIGTRWFVPVGRCGLFLGGVWRRLNL